MDTHELVGARGPAHGPRRLAGTGRLRRRRQRIDGRTGVDTGTGPDACAGRRHPRACTHARTDTRADTRACACACARAHPRAHAHARHWPSPRRRPTPPDTAEGAPIASYAYASGHRRRPDCRRRHLRLGRGDRSRPRLAAAQPYAGAALRRYAPGNTSRIVATGSRSTRCRPITQLRIHLASTTGRHADDQAAALAGGLPTACVRRRRRRRRVSATLSGVRDRPGR